MKFLLDTNAVIGLLRRDEKLQAAMRSHKPDDFAMPALAAHELYYGAYKSRQSARNLALVEGLRFAVLEFDREDCRHAAEIRAALARAGTPIGPYDVLIAGQARARGLTLITHNVGEFSRVDGLRIEDWEA
ncbi:MAG TPA: type II toxin-antitoxin system VapC family toxin [Acetobacteraceae bacterium]|nr:type II toxin-antitoxin system VapC family toxin [Acetobacteraceae bacterium]